MALITIDDYYGIDFYNETKEALKNNKVEFKEFISVKPPYNYYFDVPEKPQFINFDVVPKAYSKNLVNIIMPLKPNDDYIYYRRASITGLKAINHYAINDAFKVAQKSNAGIFFHSTKDAILRISKEYPRKIYFFGKYFNRKYKVFFTDNLIIKNYINEKDVLVSSSTFKNITQLEAQLNFTIFKMQDTLQKLSETPYVLNGRYYPPSSVRPEISDTYVLS